MTLAAQISADVAPGGLMLNPNDFAETVIQYPLDVVANAVSIVGIVDLWEQTEEPPDNEFGSRLVRGLRISIPAAVVVNVDQRKQTRDTFLARGLIWRAESQESIEGGLQTVFCKRVQGASTKKTRTPG
ncbi:MAG TPA: hypothetical protein VGX76_03430 [Pirellulales bacterium]|nr:hypothetical protein [Pirellulales bacterium]